MALLLILILSLGVIQVAHSLYARNVIAASAHEGARAAAEIGRDLDSARSVAADVIRRATGDLVTDLRVDVASTRAFGAETVSVRVVADLRSWGIVPLPMRFAVDAAVTNPRARR